MPTFLCISDRSTKNDRDKKVQLLEDACKKRGLTFKNIDPSTFDFANPDRTSKGTLLYRLQLGERAISVEQTLLGKNTTTFYQDQWHGFARIRAIQYLPKAGVSTPRTVHELPQNTDLLEKAVDYLGGFPLVLKVLGGSHGVGVTKIDSFSSLASLVDFFNAQNMHAVLRQFIPVKTSARLIVLGNRVIDSIEYRAPENDFRSNVGQKPNVQVKKFSKATETLAVKATKALGLEFGGVDVLIDNKGHSYVTEVNFPCNFSRCQLLTGVDIAGRMVDHLLKKSRSGR